MNHIPRNDFILGIMDKLGVETVEDMCLEAKDSPFEVVLHEKYKVLVIIGKKYADQFIGYDFEDKIHFDSDGGNIFSSKEDGAPELFKFFGPNAQEIVISLEPNTQTMLGCDLALEHCTPNISKLDLYLNAPAVKTLPKVESLLGKFGPTLKDLRIRKYGSDGPDIDPELKKQLADLFDSSISKCTNLERFLVVWDDEGVFESDLKFLEKIGHGLKNLELDISLNDVETVPFERLEYIRESCPNLETVKLSEQFSRNKDYLEFLYAYGDQLKYAYMNELTMEESNNLAEKCPNFRIRELSNEVIPSEYELYGRFVENLRTKHEFENFHEITECLRHFPQLKILCLLNDPLGREGTLEFTHEMNLLKGLQIYFYLTSEQFVALMSKAPNLKTLEVTFDHGELEEDMEIFSKITSKDLEHLEIVELVPEEIESDTLILEPRLKNLVDVTKNHNNLESLVYFRRKGTLPDEDGFSKMCGPLKDSGINFTISTGQTIMSLDSNGVIEVTDTKAGVVENEDARSISTVHTITTLDSKSAIEVTDTEVDVVENEDATGSDDDEAAEHELE